VDSREFFEIPEYCPECNSRTIQEGQFLFCRSKACPAKLSGAIRVWVERLGLLHWGDALIDKLTDPEDPKINSIADLYRLSVEDISKCCSGMKMATKCHKQIHDHKEFPLQLFLSALNIPLLGMATATDIVNFGINSIDKLLEAQASDFVGVPNVGERTASLIYFGIQEKREFILDLSTVVNILKSEGPLSGLSFCITGALSLPRKSAEKQIMDAGGSVKSSVGKGLSYLVTNDSDTTTSKMQKAKKYGVKVISETELYELIQS
jgi:DNA ligase (NAD+)